MFMKWSFSTPRDTHRDDETEASRLVATSTRTGNRGLRPNEDARSKSVSGETPDTNTGDARATLRFWWRRGFCGFSGFRRCAARGCWTTGKILIWNGEDFVLDE